MTYTVSSGALNSTQTKPNQIVSLLGKETGRERRQSSIKVDEGEGKTDGIGGMRKSAKTPLLRQKFKEPVPFI